MKKITVRCGCGTALVVPVSAAGLKARCPQCGAARVIPGKVTSVSPDVGSPESPAGAAPGLPPAGESDAGVQGSQSAGSTEADAADLDASWEASAVLEPLASSVAGRGALWAGLAAVAMALAWSGISYATGRALPWLALLVGLVAGAAMVMATRRRHVTCGLIAAGSAAMAIAMAQVMIFQWVVLPQAQAAAVTAVTAVTSAQQAAANAIVQRAERMREQAQRATPPGMDEESLKAMDPEEARALRDIKAQREQMQTQALDNMRQINQTMKLAQDRQAKALVEAQTSFVGSMIDCSSVMLFAVAVALAFGVAAVGTDRPV